MKKYILISLIFFFPVLLFSEAYRIVDAEYNVSGAGFKFMGKTRDYPLKRKFSLDKKMIFESREDLEEYLDNYKLAL